MSTMIRSFCLFALTLSLCFAQNFRILKAEYGAENTWIDVTQRVQGMVRGDGVELRVDAQTLTDPMPGVQKNLRIRYVYNNRTQTENFADLAQVRIGNPRGGGFQGGNGGGNQGGYPPIFGGGNNGGGNNNPGFGRGLRIINARYGEGNRWTDVTRMLNDQIRNNRMRMRVSNETMGGDPAPAEPKSLQVEYAFSGRRQTITVRENEFVNLPDGDGFQGGNGGGFQGGNGLIIESAIWGAFGRTVDVTNDVQGRVQNGRLNVKASNSSFRAGDPAVNADKVLEIRYRNGNGQSQTVRVNEGGYANLP